MFPNRGETALRTALTNANGDVSLAAESLLPPVAQVLRDEALARSLQASEMPARTTDDTWSSVTQPVIDGLAAAADAAKAAVTYVASEIAAATNIADEPRPSRAYDRVPTEEDSTVITGGAGRATHSNVQLRGRSTRATSTRGNGGKED